MNTEYRADVLVVERVYRDLGLPNFVTHLKFALVTIINFTEII